MGETNSPAGPMPGQDFQIWRLIMTVLTRWEPFRDAATLQDRVSRLFNEQFANIGSEESLAVGSFVPAVDVYEDEHAIQLKFEVPGLDEKEIDIRLENSVLTVKGERKIEKETKEENYRRVERRYGTFTRSFTLPNTVSSENIHAAYDKGVLTISLPKKEAAKPKQIKIEVGKTLEPAAK
jgi:HSP20 family protein